MMFLLTQYNQLEPFSILELLVILNKWKLVKHFRWLRISCMFATSVDLDEKLHFVTFHICLQYLLTFHLTHISIASFLWDSS